MLTCRRFRSGGPMHRAVLRSLVILVIVCSSASTGFAQITAATMSGRIKDETGGVLPGADVVAKNLDTGLSRSTVSNADGGFTLARLPPGRYEVRVALQGFATSAQTVELAVAQQAGLAVTLKVGPTQGSGAAAARPVLRHTP